MRMTKVKEKIGFLALVVVLVFCAFRFLFVLHQGAYFDVSHYNEKVQFRTIRPLLDHGKKLISYTNPRNIREWGCHRKETPLIFVHIGKAGGGSVRARFASSAENYTRGDLWHAPHNDNHYYPIRYNSSHMARGKFCNSRNKQFRIPNLTRYKNKSFERTEPCFGTTPVGRAIGCPAVVGTRKAQHCQACHNKASPDCHSIYVGHNHLGSEMNWLPGPYLHNWWASTWGKWLDNDDSSKLEEGFQSLTPYSSDPSWCLEKRWTRKNYRFDLNDTTQKINIECSKSISQTMDAMFESSWESMAVTHIDIHGNSYAPIYASLPLHRVVLLRDPYSYLVSRFFWHNINLNQTCDNIATASYLDKPSLNYFRSGWVYRYSLVYLFFLCGDDCINRWELGIMTMNDMERQAEANLRNSFSVVGLLSEMDDFFDMVNTRIQYVNLSQTSQTVGGKQRHSSGNSSEHIRCKEQFETNQTFRELLQQAIPPLKILNHLYQVGMQVNLFQKEELGQCRNDVWKDSLD